MWLFKTNEHMNKKHTLIISYYSWLIKKALTYLYGLDTFFVETFINKTISVCIPQKWVVSVCQGTLGYLCFMFLSFI